MDAIDGSNKGIKIDSSTPSIITRKVVQEQHKENNIKYLPGRAGVGNTDAASLVVSQSGQPIFSVGGETFHLLLTQNLIVNSFPIEDDDVLAPLDMLQIFQFQQPKTYLTTHQIPTPIQQVVEHQQQLQTYL